LRLAGDWVSWFRSFTIDVILDTLFDANIFLIDAFIEVLMLDDAFLDGAYVLLDDRNFSKVRHEESGADIGDVAHWVSSFSHGRLFCAM
jgi:hypothetical protein